MSEDAARAQWGRVRTRLREEFGDAAFKSWLKPMALADVGGGRVRIAVPTAFLKIGWSPTTANACARCGPRKIQPSPRRDRVQPTMTRLETAPVKAQIEYVQAAPAHAP